MPSEVRERIKEALSELTEQAVTCGINWSKNSSTPIRGVNIDIDLSLPLKEATTAILSIIGEEIPKMKECLPVESAEQITHDKMEEYETYKYGYNQALTDLRARMEK